MTLGVIIHSEHMYPLFVVLSKIFIHSQQNSKYIQNCRGLDRFIADIIN